MNKSEATCNRQQSLGQKGQKGNSIRISISVSVSVNRQEAIVNRPHLKSITNCIKSITNCIKSISKKSNGKRGVRIISLLKGS